MRHTEERTKETSAFEQKDQRVETPGRKTRAMNTKKNVQIQMIGIKGGNPENAIGNSKDTLLRIL